MERQKPPVPDGLRLTIETAQETVRLRGENDMRDQLYSMIPDPKLRNTFVPLLLQHAGLTTTASEVALFIVEAVRTHDGLKKSDLRPILNEIAADLVKAIAPEPFQKKILETLKSALSG